MKSHIRDLYDVTRWRVRLGGTYLRAWLHKLRLRDTRFIGITGSAGKTTTKDLSQAILARFGPVASTLRSRNEPITVAETILETTRQDRFCIIEAGVSKPGSLDLPLRLFKPDIAALTLIGRDHYKAFKSLEAIAAEKAKLIEALPPEGTAVLNIDDPRVRAIGERCKGRIIWVGEGEGATLRLREATSRWPAPLRLTIEHQGRSFEIHTQLHGTHLALSVLSALGIALAAGIPLEQSIPVLAQATPPEGRMQIVTGEDGVVFVRDDWKAPYWSLQAPLEFLKQANTPRKVAVVGTLSDYSADASALYKRAAQEVRACADLVVFVGPHAHRALRARRDANDESIQGFASLRDAAAYLQDELRAGDLVLLKASNKADHLVRLILHRYQPIQCWQERCGKRIFCGDCSRLYKPVEEHATLPTTATSKEASTRTPAFPEPSGVTTPIVAGLGNPGTRYHHTPHNIGYRVLDALAEACGSTWEQTAEGLVCSVTPDGGPPITLFKPDAKMNRTGPVIREFLVNHGGHPDRCIIVHDDMDLALGTVRLKRDGGDGGHNGLRSVISALGTDAVRRVRVGVRRPGDTAKARQRVLEPFSADEEAALAKVIEQAIATVRNSLTETKPWETA